MKFPFFKSVKGKLMIITLVLILVTGIGAATAEYLSYTNKLRSNSIHATESNLQFLSDKLNSCIEKVDDITHWCQNSSEIIDFVMTPRRDDHYAGVTAKARLRLDEELEYNPMAFYIQRIVIANTGRENFLQCVPSPLSTDHLVVKTIMKQPYFREGLNLNRFSFNLGFRHDPFSRKQIPVIPVLLPIYHPYSTDRVGFVFTEVSQELFLNIFSDYTLSEGVPVYLTFGESTYKIEGREITPAASDYKILSRESRKFSSAQIETLQIQTSDGKKTELISYPLKLEGCRISQPLPSTPAMQDFSAYAPQFAGILCLILLLGIGFYLFLMRTFNRPVKQLNHRLGEIARGNFSTDRDIEWENEFGDIGRSINVLAGDISSLMDSRIAYEKEKKDYEYKMLQSQINPHFLYNTLNSIKWMAITQGSTGISEMATSLSRLLKSIAKGTSTIVSIHDELALLEDYFLIQKYRYGGSIEMHTEIEEPELTENQIPRFTLQPIVENAIFHGIEPKGTGGTVTVRIYRDSRDVCIMVTDNGIGMDEEKIRSLLTENTEDKTAFFKDMGVSSVHKRLQYCFGEGYGLTITSVPGEYTAVQIRLKNTLKETEAEKC